MDSVEHVQKQQRYYSATHQWDLSWYTRHTHGNTNCCNITHYEQLIKYCHIYTDPIYI